MPFGPLYNEFSTPIPIQDEYLFYNEFFFEINTTVIPGIKNYYMISNYGRVYHKYAGIFMSPGVSGSGYLFVELATDHGSQMAQIHRLVLKVFRPNVDSNKLDVNHINGNKFDNRLWNLEWCTRSYNMKHAYKTGLHSRTSIISEETAKEICKLLSENKYTNKEIANMVKNGATEHIVNDIHQKTSWTYLTENLEFEQRINRLFTPDMVENICKYFSTHDIGALTVNEHSKNALIYYNYDSSDRMIDSVRKIYTRKYYTNISQKYIF